MEGTKGLLQEFTAEEARDIRAALGRPRPLACPRCGEPLVLGRARLTSMEGTAWVYRCPVCKRGITLIGLRSGV